jgi:hypothetical protein
MKQTFAPKSASTAFARLLFANRNDQEFIPAKISFRESERQHAQASRGTRLPDYMPVRDFADHAGLPLYLIELYIGQGLLATLGEPGDLYLSVKLAKRQLAELALSANDARAA